MRWPRAGIVAGVIGLVLLGAGWWLASAGAAGSGPKQAVRVIGTRLPSPLLHSLQQYLAGSRAPHVPPRVPPPPRNLNVLPYGRPCAVAAGGFCSATPCVVYAGNATATAVAAVPGAAVLRPAAPGATTCQGHSGPPRIQRVAGF